MKIRNNTWQKQIMEFKLWNYKTRIWKYDNRIEIGKNGTRNEND